MKTPGLACQTYQPDNNTILKFVKFGHSVALGGVEEESERESEQMYTYILTTQADTAFTQNAQIFRKQLGFGVHL